MYTPVKRIIIGLLLILSPALALAGIISYPGLGDPTYSQEELDAAFASGRATGRQESAVECLGDPGNCGCVEGISPCGISLSSVLTEAQFGETEPNDHIIAADPLITAALYWGQSRSLTDQDWYYVTTVEPNQLLTLTFTVPDRVLVDNGRLSQGWLVSIRDAANNIYAQFDTRFALDDTTTESKNESKEITYPVFLGHTGTYYVVVQPSLSPDEIEDPNLLSILYWPYNLAGILTFSGLDAAPPDVNFHDVEVEPNDTALFANPLASGVTMYGLLRQTSESVYTDEEGNSFFYQTDVDWFKYESAGDEQIVLAWCGREACTNEVYWFVQVFAPDVELPILSFNTDKSETVHFGLDTAGTYNIAVSFQRKQDAECVVFKPEPECLVEEYQCQVLDITAGKDGEPDTCEYKGGDICQTGNESGETASCELAGTPGSYTTWRWQNVCTDFGFACAEDGYTGVIDTNALNVEYNFTWWGTGQPPLSSGSEAEAAAQELPNFYTDPF